MIKLELSQEQIRAYERFIRARDKIKLVKTDKNMRNAYIPHRDYIDSIAPLGLNHSVFIVNDDWLEYKAASSAWWAVEPRFREEERMRATKGDYGSEDNWDEEDSLEDIFQYFKDTK